MSVLSLPPMPSGTLAQQVQQQYTYLFQLAQALNLSLQQLEQSEIQQKQTGETRKKEAASLKDLIVKTAGTVREEICRLDGELLQRKRIHSVQKEYYTSDSDTELLGGTWTEGSPALQEGRYIWTRSVLTFDGDYPTVYTEPVCATGVGEGVEACDIEYGVSNSTTAEPTAWQETLPETAKGQILWSRTKVRYTDASCTYVGTDCMARYTVDVVSPAIKELVDSSVSGVYTSIDEYKRSMESTFLAKSDFGSYLEQLTLGMAAEPSGIAQYYKYMSEVIADAEKTSAGFTAYKSDVQGYIRQGIVRYDGTVPVIGIAIGQDIQTLASGVKTETGSYDVIDTRSNMSVWTTEKLSFYIGGQEAAYFSNGKLTVRQIAIDRMVGAGMWDVTFAGGVRFKWIGG